jgi:thioredoxin-related protein
MSNIKRLLCIILMSFPLCFLSNKLLAQSDKGISWIEGLTWGQIKEKAKKENKYIFVDAYTTWCVPCKKMDKEVYPNVSVGETLNSQFISVKVQMDRTKKDNDEVKKWYPVVQEFNDQYSIEGYPSFLFFNPDGILVHKGLGLQDVSSFIALAKDALTDPEARYQSSLNKFKAGQLDYSLMPYLARQARKKRDEKTANEIAKEFKQKYLDKLNDDEVFIKKNLLLLMEFSYTLLNTSDRYFKFFYKQPDLADSIIDKTVFGKRVQVAEKKVVIPLIRKEEVSDKIYKDGKPVTRPEPNWNAIHKSVLKKYGEKYCDILFPFDEIVFYNEAKDWKNFMKYVEKRMKKYPPKPNGKLFGVEIYSDAGTLNLWTWEVFKGCNDNKLLEKAVLWAELAISLEEDPAIKAYYVDTKANLLYKLGRVKEAIELEQKAVELSKGKDESINEIFGKMKAGLPTWPEKTNN